MCREYNVQNICAQGVEPKTKWLGQQFWILGTCTLKNKMKCTDVVLNFFGLQSLFMTYDSFYLNQFKINSNPA